MLWEAREAKASNAWRSRDSLGGRQRERECPERLMRDVHRLERVEMLVVNEEEEEEEGGGEGEGGGGGGGDVMGVAVILVIDVEIVVVAAGELMGL